MNKNNQYKSIFLSDIHLGFNGCQNEKLEHFLKSVSCENLYLVGDIIDFWSMEEKFYWPEGHQRVLNIFDQMFKNGTCYQHNPPKDKFCSGLIKSLKWRCAAAAAPKLPQ